MSKTDRCEEPLKIRNLNNKDLDKVSGGQIAEGAYISRCYNCHEYCWDEHAALNPGYVWRCTNCGCCSWEPGYFGDEQSYKPEETTFNCGNCWCRSKMYCKR